MMEGTDIESGASTGGTIDPNISPAVTVDSVGGGQRSEEDTECYDQQDNAFMNELILNNIFKNLSRGELKECRFVCQMWNVLTIPFTREEFQVRIHGNQDLTKEHTIDNFVKVFGSNKWGIPFARFALGSFCTTDGVGQEFLQLCGNTTRHIDFLEDNIRIEDVSELLKSTTNLETLEIPTHLHSGSGNIVKLFPEDSKPRLSCLKYFTLWKDNPKERNKCCPTFLEELITAAENISSLKLKVWGSNSSDDEEEESHICSSFEVLSIIEKLGREPSIQDIEISNRKEDDSEYVELLHKMASKQNGLKLRSLDYDAANSDQDSKPFSEMISLFKDTLESLQINRGRFTCFVDFQEMSRLTGLFVFFSEYFTSGFANISKIFPVLKTMYLFDLNDDDHEEYDEFFPQSDPCPTITSLTLRGFTLKLNGFNQLLTVFPNVTDLRVDIKSDGEEILRQIWTQMTQLETLHISAKYDRYPQPSGTIEWKDSLDCVLTGIPDQVLHEVRDAVNNLDKMTEVERREAISVLRNQHSQLPSIGNLTKLRELTLDLCARGIRRPDGNYLTDYAGYLGFYSMQSLKKLTVRKCEMTKTCCDILTMDMGLKEWKFKSSHRVDISSGST